MIGFVSEYTLQEALEKKLCLQYADTDIWSLSLQLARVMRVSIRIHYMCTYKKI